MKNKFIKFVSSVLIAAFLISCFAVFSFADTTSADAGASDENESPLTVLTNRTFNEGWNYDNGFNVNQANHNFEVEYEQTEDYNYNYYTRIEGTSINEGYLEAYYGSNSATSGSTVFEFDIKTDDITDLGNIAYTYRKENNSAMCTIPLAAIRENILYLPDSATIDVTNTLRVAPDPDYVIGNTDNEWIRVAFVIEVDQKICPVCGNITVLPPNTGESETICCEDKPGAVIAARMKKCMTINVYYGYADTFNPENALEARKGIVSEGDTHLNNTYHYQIQVTNLTTPEYFRIGFPSQGKNNFGSSILIDNVKLYNGATLPTELTEYGVNVNENAAKTVEILGGQKTVTQYINEGLVMKVGVNNSLKKGQKAALLSSAEGNIAYGAPVEIDGTVYVPLQSVLDWVGYPMYAHEDGVSFDISTESGSTFIGIGRSLATANGELIQLKAAPALATDERTGIQYIVVALDDIETLFSGYYVTYDEMGLIIISGAPNLVNRETDLNLILDICKQFVYDYADEDTIYDEVKSNTNNFQHPYIIANQDNFDSIYNSQSANVKSYIASIKAQADDIYNEYTTQKTDEEGNLIEKKYAYLADEIININTLVEEDYANNGYDYAIGQLKESGEYNNKILTLAFAYQVTRDAKYALLAYDMAVSMSKWVHWGPAYFISLADAVTPYALAYDWLYNIWKSEGCDLSVVENALYKLGLLPGYYSTNGLECEILSNQGDFSAYTNRTDSWNVLGTSAMVIASLALLGVGDNMNADGRTNELYSDLFITQSAFMIENNIKTLTDVGLDMYAPDGSFLSSPYYWGRATNALSMLSWALITSVGDDCGLMRTCGVDNTWYYAYQIEYSMSSLIYAEGYQYWAYHDAPIGYSATEMSFFASNVLKNIDFATLRLAQLGKKPVTMWDILAYKDSYDNLDLSSVKLELDYVIENCEGIVSRSSWEDGALFVGIMGNRNDADGGQIDSGNFVYSNMGFNWICDLGGENHGVANYTNIDKRYTYYRMNGDGNNVVVLTSNTAMSSGQLLGAGGTLNDYAYNEHGMYALIDNSAVYGSAVNIATRGMLLTNDRSTMVIQDYLTFTKVTSCASIIHTPASNIIISSDGRTAYLQQQIDGQTKCIRASILSASTSITFEKGNATKGLLGNTTGRDENNREQISRKGYQKLYIQVKDVLAFDCAVVFEVVATAGASDPVKYNRTELASWNEDLITDVYVAPVVDEYERTTPLLDDIIEYTEKAEKLYNNGYAFSTKLKDFYQHLVLAEACVKDYEPTGQIASKPERQEWSDRYYYVEKDKSGTIIEESGYKVLFNTFKQELNNSIGLSEEIGVGLSGYIAPTPAEEAAK